MKIPRPKSRNQKLISNLRRQIEVLSFTVEETKREREKLRKDLVSTQMSHGSTKGQLFRVQTELEKANRVLTAIRAISDPLKLDFAFDFRVAQEENLVAMSPEKD